MIIFEYAWLFQICLIIPEYAWISLNRPDCCGICLIILEYAQLLWDMPNYLITLEYDWLFLNMLDYH